MRRLSLTAATDFGHRAGESRLQRPETLPNRRAMGARASGRAATQAAAMTPVATDEPSPNPKKSPMVRPATTPHMTPDEGLMSRTRMTLRRVAPYDKPPV